MNLISTEINDGLKIDSFHCQSDKVNEFFHTNALYNNQNLLSKVYVLVDKDTDAIAGIITLSAYRLNLPHSKKILHSTSSRGSIGKNRD